MILSTPELRALRLEAQLLRAGTGAASMNAVGGRGGGAGAGVSAAGLSDAGVSDAAVDAVVAVVERLVAMQGQDLPAVQRAIALRAGVGLDAVAEAFARGRIVRGWPMRGTLFVTTPGDLAALGTHSRAQMRTGLDRRREQLGITPELVARAAATGLARLAEGPATRAELLDAWRAAGIDVDSQRGYHYIATLSQEGHWHWAGLRGKEQELVASEPSIALAATDADRGAAFARILRGYLDGHGPATLADLAWWTKASKTELRRAVAAVGDEVVVVRLADAEGPELLVRPAQLDDPARLAAPEEGEIHLLPAFDEYYLGYADRSPVASAAVQAAVVPGGNGMFRPIVLSAGRVVGTWVRGTRKSDPPAIVDLLEPVSAAARAAIDAAAA